MYTIMYSSLFFYTITSLVFTMIGHRLEDHPSFNLKKEVENVGGEKGTKKRDHSSYF